MKIFVTGGTGFIGSHFVKEALSAGHQVRALRRPGSLPRIHLPKEPEWVEATLADVPIKALNSCEALVHFAAHGVENPTEASWEKCFKTNVTDSLQLWQRAIEAGINNFVICGSCFEYGKSGLQHDNIPYHAQLIPTGAYHSSKAAATMAATGLAIENSLRMVIIRPFHVYGEGEKENRFYPSLKKAARLGQDFKMTTGEQVRDFTEVTETAKEFLKWATDEASSFESPKIINFGSGIPKSLSTFAKEEWKASKANGRLLMGEIEQRPNEIMRYVPEIT